MSTLVCVMIIGFVFYGLGYWTGHDVGWLQGFKDRGNDNA